MPLAGGRLYSYEPDQPSAERMGVIAQRLVETVKKCDKTRPVTTALNCALISNETKYPEVLDIVGYNYQEHLYAEGHRKYPKRIIYGSENSHSLNAWLAVDTNTFISGQFLWTGIDYLGESSWPSRGSASGLLDLAGFPKPMRYYY